MVGTKVVFTGDHQPDDIIVAPMSRKWLAEGASGKFAVGNVETTVSQKAGPSLPPQDMQSAPTLSAPNVEGNDDGLTSSSVQVKIAAGNKGTAKTSWPGSDEKLHVTPLKYHLCGWLELTEIERSRRT